MLCRDHVGARPASSSGPASCVPTSPGVGMQTENRSVSCMLSHDHAAARSTSSSTPEPCTLISPLPMTSACARELQQTTLQQCSCKPCSPHYLRNLAWLVLLPQSPWATNSAPEHAAIHCASCTSCELPRQCMTHKQHQARVYMFNLYPHPYSNPGRETCAAAAHRASSIVSSTTSTWCEEGTSVQLHRLGGGRRPTCRNPTATPHYTCNTLHELPALCAGHCAGADPYMAPFPTPTVSCFGAHTASIK